MLVKERQALENQKENPEAHKGEQPAEPSPQRQIQTISWQQRAFPKQGVRPGYPLSSLPLNTLAEILAGAVRQEKKRKQKD